MVEASESTEIMSHMNEALRITPTRPTKLTTSSLANSLSYSIDAPHSQVRYCHRLDYRHDKAVCNFNRNFAAVHREQPPTSVGEQEQKV